MNKMYTIYVTTLGETSSYPQSNLDDCQELFKKLLEEEMAQLLEYRNSDEFQIHVESDHTYGKATIIQKKGNIELFTLHFKESKLQ